MYAITCDIEYARTRQVGNQKPEPRKKSNLIAYVGDGPEGKDAKKVKASLTGKVESEIRITNELLGYNATKGIVLIRVEGNSRDFDVFVGMPFTKGVTDKKNGRTLLITGDYTHHGEAMQGQYDCDPEPYTNLDGKGFGDVIRWINVGTGRQGFLGLDYNPKARKNSGMALTIKEVQHLCKALTDFGMDAEKYVRLLDVPHIKESKQGQILRVEHKLETLDDWVSADISKINRRLRK